MNLNKTQEEVLKTISDRFSKKRKTVREKIAFTTLALIKGKACTIPEIAMQMGSMNGKAFHTNEMRINRLLQTKTFQVDDALWRSHMSIVFDLLRERGIIQKGSLVPINIDYTSSTDDFLILSASIPFEGRGIPLYFSMRNYPKKKKQVTLKKMEEAFLKELRHLLSQKYSYVIIGDRGFGNTRIMRDCKALGFDYILRLAENISFEHNEEKRKLSSIQKEEEYAEVFLTAKKQKTRLLVSVSAEKKKGMWRIATSLEKQSLKEVVEQYAKRFHIEKMFQDEKSSGFCIENLKIKKYDRFKKLYYLVSLAQVFLMFIGDYLNGKSDAIKKRFPLHIRLISAFSD